MKNGKCIKCGCPEVIRSKAADYGDDDYENDMAVTAEPRWVFSGRNPRHPHGVLYTYTCRICGYTEWYAESPGDIPIGEKYGTAIIRPRDKA